MLRKRTRRPPELPRGTAVLRAGVGTRTRQSNRGPATGRGAHPQRPTPGIDQADREEEAQAECALLVRQWHEVQEVLRGQQVADSRVEANLL